MNFTSPVPSNGHLYELQKVEKHYGSDETRVAALDGVDLEIAQGEFVVVVGPSGSGKSTLLQLLGGLDRASSGTVRFDDTDLATLGDEKLAALRLRTFGFIFQQFNLIPTLTAAENVELALVPTGMKGADREAHVKELLQRVGLAPRAEHLPSQLSGGEQQRVAIARALGNSPRVLLADEPTGNLDSKTGAEVLSLLREIAGSEGRAVVLITHDESIAAEARVVLHMRDGRLVVGSDDAGSEQPATAVEQG